MIEANVVTLETLTRKAFVGTGWSALSNLARQSLSMVSVAILARLLGPSAYGLMGMAALILTFLANFRDLGTAGAIIQRPHVSKRLLSSLFWVNCLLGVILFLAGLAAAAPAARFFHEPKLFSILQAISVTFCLTTVGSVPNALLARRMAFDKIAIGDFVSALLGYCVAIPCAFAGLGVWSLVIGNLAGAAAGTTLYWTFSRWHPSWEFDVAELRSVSRFSLNLAGSGVVNYFSRNADNVVVGRILGSNQLGYYQMAYNLFLFPMQNVTSVIAQVLNPAFSKIQDDNERFRSAYVRSCMLIGLVTFPLMAGLGVVADPFVRTLLGEKWAQVIPILAVLVPVGFCQSIQSTTGQIYIAKGRTDLMFRWSLYATSIFVASFLIGVRWGATGVASAYAISYFTLVLYPALWIAFRLIDLSVAEFGRRLLPQITITLAMTACCFGWINVLRAAGVSNPLVHLTSTVVIGAAVYIGAMLTIRPLVIMDLEEILATSNTPLSGAVLGILGKGSRVPS